MVTKQRRIPVGTGFFQGLRLRWWGIFCPHYVVGPWPSELVKDKTTEASPDFRCLRCARLPHTWAKSDGELNAYASAGASRARR